MPVIVEVEDEVDVVALSSEVSNNVGNSTGVVSSDNSKLADNLKKRKGSCSCSCSGVGGESVGVGEVVTVVVVLCCDCESGCGEEKEWHSFSSSFRRLSSSSSSSMLMLMLMLMLLLQDDGTGERVMNGTIMTLLAFVAACRRSWTLTLTLRNGVINQLAKQVLESPDARADVDGPFGSASSTFL